MPWHFTPVFFLGFDRLNVVIYTVYFSHPQRPNRVGQVAKDLEAFGDSTQQSVKLNQKPYVHFS